MLNNADKARIDGLSDDDLVTELIDRQRCTGASMECGIVAETNDELLGGYCEKVLRDRLADYRTPQEKGATNG